VTVRLTIEPFNHPPRIVTAPVASGIAGQPYAYDVNAIDQDPGERLAYALDLAPSGMTIAPDTGLIQWLPAANQTGSHALRVRAYDASGAFAEQSFTLTVTRRVIVPDVVGQTQTVAESTVTGPGLTVGTITSRYHPSVPAGEVLKPLWLARPSVKAVQFGSKCLSGHSSCPAWSRSTSLRATPSFWSGNHKPSWPPAWSAAGPST
jgi:hypothetical protein